ncbi:MAG: hypothetical protein WCT29_01630 [Candidatus Paceibacterota bacterium]|jgi:hypothetical protein
MDIKDLNKSQLILLAVLLSFITSIATGITTVTLMQQAPASVTVPVNRVIQQTVEKIQQVEGKTTVQTVVVKEEDLVVDAIAKNRDAVFNLIKGDDFAAMPAGRAFAVSSEGIIVADTAFVPGEGTYYAENASGKFRAHFVASQKGFSFLKLGAPVNATDKLTFSVPTAGDISKMKIGQKVIVLGKKISTSIFEENDVNITVNADNAGSMVLDLDGNVLGIALSNAAANFSSIQAILEALAVAAPTGAQQ